MSKVTVSGDIGSFTTGQVLKRDKDIASYFRTMADEGADKPTALTDEQILAIVEHVQENSDADNDDDKEIEIVEAIEKGGVIVEAAGENTAEAIEQITATGNAIALAAATMGKKLGEWFTKDTNEVIDANETKKRGPIVVAFDLEEDLTPEEIEAMPEPGSKVDTVGANALYDRFTETVIVDGQRKKKPASYYRKMYLSSAAAEPVLKIIRGLDAAIGEKADAPAEYKRMAADARGAMRDRFAKRISTGVQNMTSAVRLLKQKVRIDRMEHVGFRYLLERDNKNNVVKDERGRDKIMNTPTPIVLFNRKEPGETHVVSVGTFLTYDIDKALSKGGTLTALMETSNRGTKEPEKKTDAPRYDLDVMAANVNLMVDFAEKLRADEKSMGNLYARLNSPAGQDFLANCFKLEEFLENVITSKKELQKTYAKIEAELSADGERPKVVTEAGKVMEKKAAEKSGKAA